jgi:hypothetical protein
MSRMALLSLVVAFLSGSSAFGADTVACFSSGKPFELRGVPVLTNDIPSWPLVAGDDIKKTITSPAIIRFADGSRVEIDGHSWVKIESQSRLRLLQGALRSNVSAGSNLQIMGLEGRGIQSGAFIRNGSTVESKHQIKRVHRPSPLRPRSPHRPDDDDDEDPDEDWR